MIRARYIFGIVIVIALVILGYWGYATYLAPLPPTPTPQAPTEGAEAAPLVVSAEGQVVPARYVRLSFDIAGTVEEVFVQKGETVQAGQIIARLKNREQFEAAITAAKLELLSAQQALDALSENAEVNEAQAARVIADLRDAVRDAERRLNNLLSPAEQTDIEQARANVAIAREKMKKAREDYEPYAKKPEDNLVRATLLSKKAQAEEEYEAAVRRLNNLLSGANEIDAAQAEAELALAQAQLAQAQKNYAELENGIDPDALALAQARLENAAAQMAAAQAAARNLELRAPFAGTLVVNDLKVGQYVLPGTPLVVLADISQWQVETNDLAEVDVALLQPGMSATITLDAFPGREFSGVIRLIDYLGQERRGDMTYTVTLDFDPGDVPVRWGMTAYVDIPILK